MGRRHTATCTGTGGGAELSGAKQAGIWGLQHCLPSPLLPLPSQTNTCPQLHLSRFYFLQLFLEKYGYFSEPGRGTHSPAEFSEALRYEPLIQRCSSGCRDAASTPRVFVCSQRGLSAAGGSLPHGLMLKHSQPFLGRRVRARLPQLGAGCWHPPLAALFAFYGPAARLAIKSAGRPRLGTAGRCQGAELPAPAWASPRVITSGLGASRARPCAKPNAKLNMKSKNWG